MEWYWWIIIALGVLAVIIYACTSSKYGTQGTSSDSTREVPNDDQGQDDDYDECRCSTPGGSCCWK